MNEYPAYQHNRLVSTGNLQYLDFIRVVQKLWIDTHPDIPFFASTGEEFATYPVITYRLQYRNPVNENKPRVRETIATAPNQPAIINKGMRFNNFVTFTVYTQNNPQQAEAIIEEFEDFMVFATPIVKQLGLSDIFYARREPDQSDQRPGGITRVERSITYNAITEKILQLNVDKINNYVFTIRQYLVEGPEVLVYAATPNQTVALIDQFSGATPN